jgi:hypothetical protein
MPPYKLVTIFALPWVLGKPIRSFIFWMVFMTIYTYIIFKVKTIGPGYSQATIRNEASAALFINYSCASISVNNENCRFVTNIEATRLFSSSPPGWLEPVCTGEFQVGRKIR